MKKVRAKVTWKTLVARALGCSGKEAGRLIEQAAVKLNDVVISDQLSMVEFYEGDILRIGKRRAFRLMAPKDERPE